MKSLFENIDFEPPESLKIKSLASLVENLPKSSKWMKILGSFSETEDFSRLEDFLISEYSSNYCFPKPDQIFRSLQLTPFENVRVVILGQDPYHGMGQADGLAFSVPNGVKTPPSLRNIIVEMGNDIGGELRSTDLSSLSAQGILLLNTCLTVRNSAPGSHRGKGWETLINSILTELNNGRNRICFVLWGKDAEILGGKLDAQKHKVFKSAHPSPLSAHRGFFGSKPFSNVNKALIELGFDEINWLM
ncbi:MAG: uracil-DNA glycosylase [Crocinitomicaceae bacterium]|nr:uracil-DNA glycosylase [Crocinitomicaceae bacterium]